MKKIGIYKITSPSGKVYIGQSIDIEKRWNKYKNLHCNEQTKLYRSLNKHGIESHTFEIIEECSVEMLNQRERFYQDLYNVIGDKGLNCKLTETSDKTGELSNETKLKLSESAKKLYENGFVNPMQGKKANEATKLKMSESKKGKKITEETKIKIGQANKGRKFNNDVCKKFSDVQKRLYESGYINPKSKKVINIETGDIYNSISECERKTIYKKLREKLRGDRRNNTPIQYL
jgi:group I intron endonuclease